VPSSTCMKSPTDEEAMALLAAAGPALLPPAGAQEVSKLQHTQIYRCCLLWQNFGQEKEQQQAAAVRAMAPNSKQLLSPSSACCYVELRGRIILAGSTRSVVTFTPHRARAIAWLSRRSYTADECGNKNEIENLEFMNRILLQIS